MHQVCGVSSREKTWWDRAVVYRVLFARTLRCSGQSCEQSFVVRIKVAYEHLRAEISAILGAGPEDPSTALAETAI
jgi:hypothetical protein